MTTVYILKAADSPMIMSVHDSAEGANEALFSVVAPQAADAQYAVKYRDQEIDRDSFQWRRWRMEALKAFRVESYMVHSMSDADLTSSKDAFIDPWTKNTKDHS